MYLTSKHSDHKFPITLLYLLCCDLFTRKARFCFNYKKFSSFCLSLHSCNQAFRSTVKLFGMSMKLNVHWTKAKPYICFWILYLTIMWWLFNLKIAVADLNYFPTIIKFHQNLYSQYRVVDTGDSQVKPTRLGWQPLKMAATLREFG